MRVEYMGAEAIHADTNRAIFLFLGAIAFEVKVKKFSVQAIHD